MAIRKIAQLGEPVLRRVAEPIAPAEIHSERIAALTRDLIETMRDADGAGIAAPQVYESIRLCVVEVRKNPRYPHFPEIPLMVLINPEVEALSSDAESGEARGTITMFEGCLSVPGLRGKVRRPRKVRVKALDENGAPLELVWEGVRAAVIQHELDHLDGILFVDRALPRSLMFQREYDRYVPLDQRVADPG
jgi:peptide deformylase